MYNVQGVEACKIDVQGMKINVQGVPGGKKKVSKGLKLAKLMSKGFKKIDVQGKTQGLKFVRLMSRG